MPVSPRISFSRPLLSALMAAATGLSGCGDSDSPAAVTVSGSVFAAPVSGASCEIRNQYGEAAAGPFTTAADGSYTVTVDNGEFEGNMMLVCNGGHYTDEADGSSQTAGTMAAYVGANGTSIHATPASTIVYQLVAAHNMSLAEAETAVETAFGYRPDVTVAPTDATGPRHGATEDQLLAGLRAATFSQLTLDLGLNAAEQFALLTALAQDLSDGTLDGVDNNGAVTIPGTAVQLSAAIQNRFNNALFNFRAGNDATGLGNDKLGVPPFAKLALTNSYKLEYIPGMMAAMQGKTQFKIRLTDRVTELAVTGATINLMPMMYMAMGSHASPVDSSCSDNGDGTYNCTAYYLMASIMMNGDSMGYWDLKVMANGEASHFHPPVMMAMGDTARTVLKGVNDKIEGMMAMPEARAYYLFKSALSGTTNNHTFQLFIAAKENMMSFPAVYSPLTLNTGDISYELNISSMSVEVSTDLNTWVAADGSSNDGYWTATGITGLTDGMTGELYVRMSVNGEQKSTNGDAVSGINAYATFSVTPGAM